MNIVRISRLLKHSALLLSLLGSGFLLSACGGDSKKTTTSSSSSSTSSSHSFSSTPVTTPGNGTWPNVKVSANGTKSLKFDWTAATGATYYKLFKKPDSSSVYTQVGADFNSTTISDAVSVHLTDWVNSRYKVQACSSSGCADSAEIVIDSAMLSAITYIKASNTEADDWFGWSIAISRDGNTLAVGAPNESSNAIGVNGDQSSNTSPTSGAVYVFTKTNGSWSQQAYLKASNTEQPTDGITQSLPNSRFGYQVALSGDGNTLAVSAINEDSRSIGINCEPNYATSTVSFSSSSNRSAGYYVYRSDFNVGAVYVFKRENTVWSQQAYIKPLNPVQSLAFGYSLTISGDGKTLAIGAPVEASYVAGIYVNTNSSSSSSCINFSSSDSSSSSSSSTSSSSSSTSSSSSSSSSIPGGSNSGAVYLYKFVDNKWIEDSFVKAGDAGAGDSFGESISLTDDGNTLAVGAALEDSKDTSAANDTVTLLEIDDSLNTGAAYIFQRTDSVWTQQAKVKPSHNEWYQLFGTSVALSGDGSTLAVGTPGDWSKSAGVNSDPTNYILEALKYLSSYTYYITPKTDTSYGTGAAYVFRKSDATTWAQEAYIKPSNPQVGYQFGSVLSLSYTGDILAVGTWIESSLATGINGDQLDTSSPLSGAAYSFVRTGNSWQQKAYIKAPVNNSNDRFGHALGLDGTGEELVIGAHREASKATGINGDKTDNSASASGAIYIY